MNEFSWIKFSATSLSSALAVLTAMITPALLISACGTFIISTSNRLGRVVDRVRKLSDIIEEMLHHENTVEMFAERRAMLLEQLSWLSMRSLYLQRSLTTLYLSAGIFVASSVAIGIVSVLGRYAWVPVSLGILGACFLFYAAVILIMEARLAVRSMSAEREFLLKLVRRHERPPAA